MGKGIPDDEKRRVVEEWDQSGLSAAAFGEPRGIHPATLGAWGREVRGLIRRRPPKRPLPREVKLVELPKGSASEIRVEFELGRERRLIVSGALTAEMIVELVAGFDAVAPE